MQQSKTVLTRRNQVTPDFFRNCQPSIHDVDWRNPEQRRTGSPHHGLNFFDRPEIFAYKCGKYFKKKFQTDMMRAAR